MVVFKVPEQVFMAVFNYIQTRPFNEVNQIVNAMVTQVTREDVPEPQPPTAPTDKE
jgi:hypothetical protein